MLDRWLALALEFHSADTVRFLGKEKDPFRNPVGHTLRENLAVLLEQLLGSMEAEPAQAAVGNILRIRAVQDLTASQAVQFVFQLRPILRQFQPAADYEVLDGRIDQLALWAFEEYVRCRERLADIRIRESRRGMGVAVARREPRLKEPGLSART
jgi:hypothetical protein